MSQKLTNHAPGGWFSNNCTVCSRLNHDVIAYTGANADQSLDLLKECQANAILIATSPDMLEVLETIENDSGQVPEWLWERIKTVIKKAKGEL